MIRITSYNVCYTKLLRVTAFILTQIVLEAAKRRNSLLPVSVLHLIIRYGDNALGEFFEKYFQKTIHNYIETKIV